MKRVKSFRQATGLQMTKGKTRRIIGNIAFTYIWGERKYELVPSIGNQFANDR